MMKHIVREFISYQSEMEFKDIMKKRKLIQLAILCVAVIFTCTACGNRPTLKERVLSVFEEQEELIREKIEKYSAGDEVEWDDLEGVVRVDTYFGGMIEFDYIVEGILTSSLIAGTYYAPDDEPRIVGYLQGAGELEEDGNGYSYSDGTDNRYYTERICENFYYFQTSN